MEDSPRRLQLKAGEAEAINHAYGTNGIITALTLATTSSVRWQEVTIDCSDWSKAVELLLKCSRSAVDLHLCTLLEKQIVDVLPSWSGPSRSKHRLLILVAPDGISTLERMAIAAGTAVAVTPLEIFSDIDDAIVLEGITAEKIASSLSLIGAEELEKSSNGIRRIRKAYQWSKVASMIDVCLTE